MVISESRWADEISKQKKEDMRLTWHPSPSIRMTT